MTLKTLFKNVADAIREKSGITSTIRASDFPAQIRSLPVVSKVDNYDGYCNIYGSGDYLSMRGDVRATSASYDPSTKTLVITLNSDGNATIVSGSNAGSRCPFYGNGSIIVKLS